VNAPRQRIDRPLCTSLVARAPQVIDEIEGEVLEVAPKSRGGVAETVYASDSRRQIESRPQQGAGESGLPRRLASMWLHRHRSVARRPGLDSNQQIRGDPEDSTRVFTWRLNLSFDDRKNVIVLRAPSVDPRLARASRSRVGCSEGERFCTKPDTLPVGWDVYVHPPIKHARRGETEREGHRPAIGFAIRPTERSHGRVARDREINAVRKPAMRNG
jgi:hypothetical protein